jgi:hypothetical protein
MCYLSFILYEIGLRHIASYCVSMLEIALKSSLELFDWISNSRPIFESLYSCLSFQRYSFFRLNFFLQSHSWKTCLASDWNLKGNTLLNLTINESFRKKSCIYYNYKFDSFWQSSNYLYLETIILYSGSQRWKHGGPPKTSTNILTVHHIPFLVPLIQCISTFFGSRHP